MVDDGVHVAFQIAGVLLRLQCDRTLKLVVRQRVAQRDVARTQRVGCARRGLGATRTCQQRNDKHAQKAHD